MWKVDVGVGPHERKVRPELVKLNEKVISYIAVEPGDITAAKWLARDAVL